MAYAWEDISIASATGASELIVAAGSNRARVQLTNPHGTNVWWINETGGTAAANAAGCRPIPALETITCEGGNAITGIATATTPLTVLKQ